MRHIGISDVERGTGFRPERIENMAGHLGIGFGRKGGGPSLDDLEALGAEIARDQRNRRLVVLVGEDGELDAARAELIEHLERAGIRRGGVLLVLGVEGAEFAERLVEQGGIPGKFCGHESLDEFEHAVSHFISVRVHRVRGPSVLDADVVARVRKVGQGIEDGAVEIEDDVRESHGVSLSGCVRTIVHRRCRFAADPE